MAPLTRATFSSPRIPGAWQRPRTQAACISGKEQSGEQRTERRGVRQGGRRVGLGQVGFFFNF